MALIDVSQSRDSTCVKINTGKAIRVAQPFIAVLIISASLVNDIDTRFTRAANA
jgi:hypothetical protein